MEVGVHVSGHLVPEILRVERRGIHRAALNHHVGLDIVWCAVLGVGRVQVEGFRLVAVASTFRAHVFQDFLFAVGESHHGEILRVVHELLGVTLLGDIDRDGRRSPRSPG